MPPNPSPRTPTSDPVLRPDDVLARNLSTAAQALEGWLIPYWLVRAEGYRHRLVVAATSRATVLNALARATPPLHGELFRHGQPVARDEISALLHHPAAGEADWLRAYRVYESGSPAWEYGARYGVDIEFWRLEDSVLYGPRPTFIGDTIHADTPTDQLVVADRGYPTFEPFVRHLPADITFPIDAVYTWVDGNDRRWQTKRDTALDQHELAPLPGSTAAARFADHGELRYSLRSLDMFAPWIRTIFIVTDAQRPSWLDTKHPRVRIVDHREILKGNASLPTFNSFAIETGLHRIDGLAEHFIYFNDDVILGAPVSPSHFFAGNGRARVFASPTAVPFGPPTSSENTSISAAKNNRTLLEREFSWTLTQAVKHAPYPLRRSVLAELAKRFPEAVDRTARNQFRSIDDVSVASSLHQWYGLLTGSCVEGEIQSVYVDIGRPECRRTLAHVLKERAAETICLNDSTVAELSPTEQVAIIGSFLDDYLPVRADVEKAPARARPLRPPSQTRGMEEPPARPTTEIVEEPPAQPTGPRTPADVPGWLKRTDTLLFEWMLTDATPEPGDLLEIGAFHGRTAIHIGGYRRPGERFTVCDLFELDSDDVSVRPGARSAYRDLSQARFESNYLTFHAELPTIVRARSEAIGSHVTARSLRFAHIDGSHLYEHVRQDLLSVRALMQPGGVIVFDNYRTETSPGTSAAVWEGVLHDGMNIICVTANKFYATFSDPTRIQQIVENRVATRSDHRIDEQYVLGQRLLRIVSTAPRQPSTNTRRDTTRPWEASQPGWRRAAAAWLPPIVAEAIRDARRQRT